MSGALSILNDVRAALATGSIENRKTLLRHVTDLFLVGCEGFSGQEITLFDEVFNRLVIEIETSARALLAIRLAPVPHAPPNIIRVLAFDDDTDVACPVLAQSERLDDPTLIENAKRKGQEHLLAIARRRSLTEAVTDVLVERGDIHVVISTVENRGARFSIAGFTGLVQRSAGNDRLAASVGNRPDIPLHLLAELVARASAHVQQKLEAEHPGARREVAIAVNEAVSRIGFPDFALQRSSDPWDAVGALHRSGELDDEQIRCFAEDGLVEHVGIALTLLSELPLGLIEQALCQESGETLLVLARAYKLSWATVRAVLQLPTDRRPSTPSEFARYLARFEKLSPATASQIVQFYKAQNGKSPH